MEKILGRDKGLTGTLVGAAVLVSLAAAMIIIAYGVESVAPGVHDTFHDFRHMIGMPCH